MDDLLRDLLDSLDAVGEEHEEIYDTECREMMGEPIFNLFIKPTEGYQMPDDFGLYSSKANQQVRLALARYIDAATDCARQEGLTLTQLEALRLVLEKEEAEERDELAHGLNWLAIIGSISPLLGLLGTVMGIMRTFLGITAAGSTNTCSRAPLIRSMWSASSSAAHFSEGEALLLRMTLQRGSPSSTMLSRSLPALTFASVASITTVYVFPFTTMLQLVLSSLAQLRPLPFDSRR